VSVAITPRNGGLLLDKMVSRRIGLDEVEDSFALMPKGEELRSVIVFG
jgi:Zn-dependent alcohol dehydrogenase